MSSRRPFRVAIVGGGPAGAALAVHLATDGADVALFADEERREIVVGESLVPAIVPSLRRLGVEDAIAAVSQVKPGVAFEWAGMRVAFTFSRYGHRMTPYAYNAPRPEFEEAIRARAVAQGARVVVGRVKLARSADAAREVELDAAARAAGGWGGDHPDLLVDATGRARAIARLLDIPARRGPRDDIAHFAHYTGHAWDEAPGYVLIGRVTGGWSWRIPLRDRLSVGIVLDRGVAQRLGDTPQARLDASIAGTPELAATLRGATRASGVATYSNYQLVTTRGFGPGWVAAGDAFGFVDPMLSPGTSVALRSAEWLAEALAPAVRSAYSGRPAPEIDFAGYAGRMTALLEAWMDLVEYLYDGRMMALVKAGTQMVAERGDALARVVSEQAERNVAMLASGTEIGRPFRHRLLRLMGRYALRGVSPAHLAIDGTTSPTAVPAPSERRSATG
jgi:flavin-dependent dehydrogenase